jgi:hypothetical protein
LERLPQSASIIRSPKVGDLVRMNDAIVPAAFKGYFDLEDNE